MENVNGIYVIIFTQELYLSLTIAGFGIIHQTNKSKATQYYHTSILWVYLYKPINDNIVIRFYRLQQWCHVNTHIPYTV